MALTQEYESQLGLLIRAMETATITDEPTLRQLIEGMNNAIGLLSQKLIETLGAQGSLPRLITTVGKQQTGTGQQMEIVKAVVEAQQLAIAALTSTGANKEITDTRGIL